MRLPFQLSIRKCSVPFLLPPPSPSRRAAIARTRRHRPAPPRSPQHTAMPPRRHPPSHRHPPNRHHHPATTPSPCRDAIHPMPRRAPPAAPPSPRNVFPCPPSSRPSCLLRNAVTCAPLMMFARQVTAQMGPHVRRSRLRKSRPRSVTTGSCGCYRTCRRTCIIHVFELGGGVFSI